VYLHQFIMYIFIVVAPIIVYSWKSICNHMKCYDELSSPMIMQYYTPVLYVIIVYICLIIDSFNINSHDRNSFWKIPIESRLILESMYLNNDYTNLVVVYLSYFRWLVKQWWTEVYIALPIGTCLSSFSVPNP